MIRIGTDCSGIGAPEQAFSRLGILHKRVFACDVDKYVKQVQTEIYKPGIFYDDLMKRDNSTAPMVDLYVAGFPCQAFSLAGKRKGFDDVRGSVFFGVADYIRQAQPEVFILENVKGLLSHDQGRTVQTITDLLSNCGGTHNGQMALDFFEDGLGYHIYTEVLNTKEHGIPQNRERWFCVGFRDPREFRFPLPEPLTTRLKDVLEQEVDEKYYLSDSAIKSIIEGDNLQSNNVNGDVASALQSPGNACGTYKGANYIRTHNMLPRSSKTGKGGTGHLSKDDGTAYCLDTGNTNAVEFVPLTEARSEEAKKIRKENMKKGKDYSPRRGKELTERKDGIVGTVTATQGAEQLMSNGSKIRKLTPLECFRLQDFPDDFHEQVKALGISETQRYKMAGNSMTVRVIEKILRRIYQ